MRPEADPAAHRRAQTASQTRLFPGKYKMEQTKGDDRGFRPPQEMKIRPFNAIAVSTSYAYFRKNPISDSDTTGWYETSQINNFTCTKVKMSKTNPTPRFGHRRLVRNPFRSTTSHAQS